jgi:hypothetical protein
VDGALVVGRTEANMENDVGSPRGIITPRTDRWWVKNVKFFNFNFNEAAALGSCSHCFSEPSTDSDSRTVKFANLMMDSATVTQKIRYQFPFKGIFHDTDGSWISEKTQTGDAWATSNWGHNIVDPACERSLDIYDGIICEGTVTVRRVVMYNYSPGSLKGRTLYILPYDDEILAGKTEEEIMQYEAEGDPDNGYELTPVQFRRKTNPSNHWTVPFVTGHKYYLRWEYGLDFERMRFEINQWQWDDPEDKDIEFELPFYDVREAITVDGNDHERISNNTIAGGNPVFGANLVVNDTESDLGKRMNLIINGETPERTRVDLTGWRCVGTDWDGKCDNEDVPEGEVEDEERRWSKISSWPNLDGRIPIDGDHIVIEPSWNMIYDLPADQAVKLKSLQINGNLTFLDGEDRLLMSHSIWVRSGALNIGTEE